jgi:iron(III) transport system permease protein
MVSLNPNKAITYWDRTALAVAVLVLIPVGVIAGYALKGFALNASDFDSIAYLARYAIAPALFETSMLIAGVLCLTLLIGVTTGWLIATYRFRGRGLLGWALVLPFAVPTYISAYTYVEAFDFFGPFQSVFRSVFGFQVRTSYWFPEVRSLGGAIWIMGLVLYPYIYVASRAAFTMQGGNIMDAARSLGCTRFEALRRTVLPIIWPSIAAGSMLVILEALNDVGASQYLGVNTFTVAIFNTWLNQGSLPGAAQIALFVLVCVVGLLWLERWMRNNRRYTFSSRNYQQVSPTQLEGWQAWCACLLCALPVVAGFMLPLAVLIGSVQKQMITAGPIAELFAALGNTVMVAALATLLILALALLITLAQRFSKVKRTTLALRISTIGYALPGVVLVIGLLPALGFFDRVINDIIITAGGSRVGLVLSGSIIAIILAYSIRFLAIGVEHIQTGLNSVSRNTDYAAQILGFQQHHVAWHILTPAMRPVIAGASILIFVDCLKELPATLLLRPLNFETLATHLYGHAARGNFEDGAIAAMLIVAAGLVPLFIMNKVMERK